MLHKLEYFSDVCLYVCVYDYVFTELQYEIIFLFILGHGN